MKYLILHSKARHGMISGLCKLGPFDTKKEAIDTAAYKQIKGELDIDAEFVYLLTPEFGLVKLIFEELGIEDEERESGQIDDRAVSDEDYED